MADTYTIDWASPPSDPFDNPHGGKLVSYTIRLAGDTDQRNIRVFQLPETPAPEKGGELYGDPVQKDGKNGPYWKFEKAKKPGWNGGGGRDTKYEADPKKLRGEAMRSAIHAASSYVSSMAGVGRVPEDFTYQQMDPMITHFYGLIIGAIEDES